MSRQFTANTDQLLSSSLALPTDATVSIWVKPAFVLGDGNIHMFFELGNSPSFNTYFQIYAAAGNNLHIGMDNNNTFTRVQIDVIGPTFPINTWSNLIVTWTTGGFMKVYLNGGLVGTSGNATPAFPSAFVWSFGNRQAGAFNATGKLSEFGVWNRVLTSTEIASIVAGGLPSSIASGLYAEYDLIGSSLAAQAGSGGTLTATGTAGSADDPTTPPPSQARVAQAHLEIALAQQAKARIFQAPLEMALAQNAKARLAQTFIEVAVIPGDAQFFGSFIGFSKTGSWGGGTLHRKRNP